MNTNTRDLFMLQFLQLIDVNKLKGSPKASTLAAAQGDFLAIIEHVLNGGKVEASTGAHREKDSSVQYTFECVKFGLEDKVMIMTMSRPWQSTQASAKRLAGLMLKRGFKFKLV